MRFITSDSWISTLFFSCCFHVKICAFIFHLMYIWFYFSRLYSAVKLMRSPIPAVGKNHPKHLWILLSVFSCNNCTSFNSISVRNATSSLSFFVSGKKGYLQHNRKLFICYSLSNIIFDEVLVEYYLNYLLIISNDEDLLWTGKKQEQMSSDYLLLRSCISSSAWFEGLNVEIKFLVCSGSVM